MSLDHSQEGFHWAPPATGPDKVYQRQRCEMNAASEQCETQDERKCVKDRDGDGVNARL